MLYEIEPSRELTGGSWYSGSELDEGLINVVHDQCYLFICQNGYVSAEAVHDFIRGTGIFKIEFSVDEISTVLNTLIFDGLVEAFKDPRGPNPSNVSGTLYKPTRIKHTQNPYTAVPCAMCPVAASCAPDSVVNPADCPYLTEWLS